VEGFLSLEQAAAQLQFSVSELSRQIEEGRVVAIVRDGSPWLSAGEVSRLKRQSERASQPARPAAEELRLLRLSPSSLLESGRSDGGETASLLAARTESQRPEPPRPLPKRPGQAPRVEPPAVESARPEQPHAPHDGAPSPALAGGAIADDKLAMQVRELNKRCAELEGRNQELEATTNRLRSGLQETEATLKRNRSARTNLENDVISLQDQLNKARARNEALEREIQHLGAELERSEDAHNSELRRLRSKGDRQHADRQADDRDAPSGGHSPADLELLRNAMLEKDRLLAQEYEQRAALRSQLEDKQQKYFELKARYDKEKGEWSDLLAQAVQNQSLLRQQIEELKVRANPKGWNPFRREK
jgi:hypothetical protein